MSCKPYRTISDVDAGLMQVSEYEYKACMVT